MRRRLEGRVAIVTGGGRGLGREHSLFLGSNGAKVVVNDLGGDARGEGRDDSAAELVCKEIEAAGGEAVPSDHDVADWDQAHDMIELAVSSFGDLHVLVNNAGILRDRTLANMAEDEWDAVVRVHLKGHAAPTRHAMAYWREKAKEGDTVRASIVHTTSISGLMGNFGQANYSAAKAGIVALSRTAALEGERYGVRSNVVSPGARTRLAFLAAGADETMKVPEDPNAFDHQDPANVAPLVGWLAAEDCPASSQIFHLIGSKLVVFSMPWIHHRVDVGRRWTLEDFDRELPDRMIEPLVFMDAWRD